MSPKRSEGFKADRQGEVLEAAKRCFVARGYDRTTMREIAAEAGVSTGAIYTYFRAKEEILQAICGRRSAIEQRDLRDALAGLPPGGDRLAAGLAAVMAPALALTPEENRERERANALLLYEATRDETFGGTMCAIIGSWRTLVVGLLEEERAAGRLREGIDVEALAAILISLPHGLEITELLGGETLDWAAILRTLGDVLHNGMAPAGCGAGAMPAPVS